MTGYQTGWKGDGAMKQSEQTTTVIVPCQDDPAPLARRDRQRGELLARDYRLVPPTTHRHDPTAIAGVCLALALGAGAVCVVGAQIHRLAAQVVTPEPTPVVTPPTPANDDRGLPWAGIALGALLTAIALRRQGHPDCPNHCPSDRPCQCGERSVNVRIDFKD